MIIHMMEYCKGFGSFRAAGEINSSEMILADALADFIIKSGEDISLYTRESLIEDVAKNLSELEINIGISDFIDKYKHPYSSSSFHDFGYAIQKDTEMLLMPGNPNEMDICSANIILRFLFGYINSNQNKEKQRFILTNLSLAQ